MMTYVAWGSFLSARMFFLSFYDKAAPLTGQSSVWPIAGRMETSFCPPLP